MVKNHGRLLSPDRNVPDLVVLNLVNLCGVSCPLAMLAMLPT